MFILILFLSVRITHKHTSQLIINIYFKFFKIMNDKNPQVKSLTLLGKIS